MWMRLRSSPLATGQRIISVSNLDEVGRAHHLKSATHTRRMAKTNLAQIRNACRQGLGDLPSPG